MGSNDDRSIPIRLLYEGVKQVITVELKNGDRYRGELSGAEDNMSIQMSSVTHTAKDGRVRKLEQIYLRGNNIRLFVLPEVLRQSPLFKKVAAVKKKYDKNLEMAQAAAGRGRGRGRRQ
mmetsp:Transcript_13526/g.15409  ORF Transcript_13526/g.15409 Transcript_13526/m.15409 type:complete len:119 (+) Transcript_13526:334-690(+)|eukprot:CAMPEP_0184025310 /NCGR_PEP_ID=MMETSP0954-20121128/12717_1 /TAXON_ID=627963 /ORGANISM="Aplanochytrium sp, Strain PBS07" /LENGTH=118 /DNA_ID=CAMNT_0026309035 /DNA_START=291 /DNA_END=647 /DNA_ORIENTATION=+